MEAPLVCFEKVDVQSFFIQLMDVNMFKEKRNSQAADGKVFSQKMRMRFMSFLCGYFGVCAMEIHDSPNNISWKIRNLWNFIHHQS